MLDQQRGVAVVDHDAAGARGRCLPRRGDGQAGLWLVHDGGHLGFLWMVGHRSLAHLTLGCDNENRGSCWIRGSCARSTRASKKPWTRSGPRLASCLAALPPVHQLEVGADLPPTAPLSGVMRRSTWARYERFIAVQSSLGVDLVAGRHPTPRGRARPPRESRAVGGGVSRLSGG